MHVIMSYAVWYGFLKYQVRLKRVPTRTSATEISLRLLVMPHDFVVADRFESAGPAPAHGQQDLLEHQRLPSSHVVVM